MKFNKILPHLVALAVFFVAVFVVFQPQFSGKSLRQSDLISHKSSAKESKDYYNQTGERANWTGTSFSGMPTYHLNTVRAGNQLIHLQKPLRAFMTGGAGIFFLGMVCSYLFLILLGVDPWLSIAGAVGASLATNGIVLFAAGHSSKVITVFYLPLVAAGTILAFRKKFLLGGLIFGLGMGLAIMANHPQMLFYFGMTMPILGLVELVKAFRAGELVNFGKSMGALVIGLLLAVGAGASNIMTTLEYTPDSMRGGQVLETPLVDETSQSADGDVPENGLSWDYAMRWSSGIKDLVATYAPLAAGGGMGQAFDDPSFARSLTAAGFQAPAPNRVPAYHGGKIEGTAGPEYLGAVIWALFFFGLFTARRSLAIWLGAGTLFVMIISMGKYAPGFNHLLYDTLPLLNKFRAPSSALNILPFMMLGLGVIGLSDWLARRKEQPEAARKQLLYSGGAAALFGLIVLFVFPSMFGFAAINDTDLMAGIQAQAPQAVNPILDGLEASRKALYMGDAWRSFLYVGLAFGVLFMLWKEWVNTTIAGLILTALIFVDFSGVNSRYLGKENWVRTNKRAAIVPTTPADQQILADTDPNFRVLNLTTNTWNDPMTSYHHKSIGGYSAVKMRRYQDVITGYLGGINPAAADQEVLDMLNAKYVINQQGQPQRRPNAFGNAWFVNNIQQVNSNDAEFQALGFADLRNTAIVHTDFTDKIAGLSPSGQGSIQLTSYTPVKLTYTANASGEQLAVFSEIWYGPDKGWEATIDGQPAELFRVNYLLRGLRVPAGQHEIVMTFTPSSYSTGKLLSLLSSLILILGVAAYAFYFGYWKDRK